MLLKVDLKRRALTFRRVMNGKTPDEFPNATDAPFSAKLRESCDDVLGGAGVYEIRGPYLDGVSAGNEELEGILCLHDAAHADHGDVNGLNHLVDHVECHGPNGGPGESS